MFDDRLLIRLEAEPRSISTRWGGWALLLAFTLSGFLGCSGGGGGTATPVAPTPTIESFTASPGTISEGQSSTLTWSVKNADGVSLHTGTPPLTGDSVTVKPTAWNSRGETLLPAMLTVTVEP